jgi:hypothetical protein
VGLRWGGGGFDNCKIIRRGGDRDERFLNFPFFPLFCFTLFLRALIALTTALCVILYLTLILLILAKYGEFPTQGEQATGQNDQELPELYDTK